jgi:hypothetical protein
VSEMLDHPVVKPRVDVGLLLKNEAEECAVEGFKLNDAACLLLNYLYQATNEELKTLLTEAKSVTETNCWCMSFGTAPSIIYLVDSILDERAEPSTTGEEAS